MSPRPNLTRLIEARDVDGLRTALASSVSKAEIDDGLFKAAMNGFYEGVTMLLEHGADVHKVDQFGSSVLHWAVQGSHFRVIDAILRAGADFRKWWTLEGESLLHWACRNGSAFVVSTLMDLGCDVVTPDSSGRRPLHTASLAGRPATVKTLLRAHPEEVNVLDENGWTALHYACTTGAPEYRQVS